MDANLPGTCWPEMLVVEEIEETPAVSKIWPNPFMNSVNIGFTLKDSGPCKIEIRNIQGQFGVLRNLS